MDFNRLINNTNKNNDILIKSKQNLTAELQRNAI